jgi:ribulose-5-phosphate 4-epimerase/fuculose-1-phosphate aldolase
MTSVAKLKTKTSEEGQLRIDLAAVFRLAEHFNWHEGVANHFSLAVSTDGKQFLMNPKWRHFSAIKASDLLLLDADDKDAMKRPNAPDETAWCIHGRMHALVPSARCVLHAHPAYATALAGLADPEIKPIDQNTARFYKRVAYDLGYEGMANSDAEGNRLAALLGNHKTMMLGNHGVLIAAASVAEAFDELYYLERACQTLMLAYASGQKLNVMSDKVAEQTARDWDLYTDSAFAHFEEMKKVLDRKDPSYAH